MTTQKLGTLELEVLADSKRFRTEFKDLARTLGRFGAVAGAALGAAALAATKAASDAGEVASKFNVVFRNVAADAQAAARELQSSYDLSGVASQRLLSNTADLLTGFGFSAEAALDMSKQTQALAADLASFNNLAGGASDASERLTKGLLGETESLKALGVVINQTTPEWKAMLKEVERTTGAAGIQAKAFAVLKMAQQQSGNAIGDYARTQRSLPNQVRALKADVEDLAVEIGKELVPAAQEAVKAARDLAGAFSANDFARVKDLVKGAKDFAAGLALEIAIADQAVTALAANLGLVLKMLELRSALSADTFDAAKVAALGLEIGGLQAAAEEARKALSGEGIERTYVEIRKSMDAAKEDAKAQTDEAKKQTAEVEKQIRLARQGEFAQFSAGRFRFGEGGRSGPLSRRGAAAAAGAYVPETGMFAPKAGQAEAAAALAREARRGSEGARLAASNANLNAAGGLIDSQGYGLGMLQPVPRDPGGGGGGRLGYLNDGQKEVVKKLDQLIEVTRQSAGGGLR